jgi:hypothetical protein
MKQTEKRKYARTEQRSATAPETMDPAVAASAQ